MTRLAVSKSELRRRSRNNPTSGRPGASLGIDRPFQTIAGCEQKTAGIARRWSCHGTVDAMLYGASLAVFDPFLVTGQRVFMETCWLATLDSSGIYDPDNVLRSAIPATGRDNVVAE
jgi:hypothetical protein